MKSERNSELILSIIGMLLPYLAALLGLVPPGDAAVAGSVAPGAYAISRGLKKIVLK